MLTMIEVDSPRSREFLQLPLEESFEPGGQLNYFVRDVDGLDPVDAEIAKSDLAGIDGVYIQSSRVGARNIVLTLGMNPDFEQTSVQSLRNELYRYFMPKGSVRINFYDNEFPDKTIVGTIESLTFPIFTKDPTATVSILCPNPYFSSINNQEVTYQVTPQSNEEELEYGGSAEAGFVLSMFPDKNVETKQYTLTVQNGSTPSQVFKFGTHIDADEMLWLDTRPGHRRLYLESGSKTRNILHTVNVDSVWPTFNAGSNLVRLYAISEPFDYTISYYEAFGGL